jgi:hypothetical protein
VRDQPDFVARFELRLTGTGPRACAILVRRGLRAPRIPREPRGDPVGRDFEQHVVVRVRARGQDRCRVEAHPVRARADLWRVAEHEAALRVSAIGEDYSAHRGGLGARWPAPVVPELQGDVVVAVFRPRRGHSREDEDPDQDERREHCHGRLGPWQVHWPGRMAVPVRMVSHTEPYCR